MVLEFLNSVFNVFIFGNELWRYFVFVLALLFTIPVSKFFAYILNNYLMKWSKKTKFKFDDILFRSINPPITMFVLAGLFYFGSSFLKLNDTYQPVFDRIFSFLIIVPIVFFLIKFTTEMLAFYLKGEKKKTKINEAGIDLLMGIVRIALLIIGVLLIIQNLGYNVTALLTGLGVGGLAFALAAQDILKNFFSGIALVFDKTFNKGERIQYQGITGRIEELKLRTTKVRTYDGSLITIPNSKLSDDVVENVTKVPKVKIAQTFGLVYNTPTQKLKKAKEIIEKAILDNEHTDKENYWIWFDNFGPSSLDVQVIYFGTLSMDDWPERVYFKEKINFEIKEKFEKAGIEFAFPTQTIELKK